MNKMLCLTILACMLGLMAAPASAASSRSKATRQAAKSKSGESEEKKTAAVRPAETQAAESKEITPAPAEGDKSEKSEAKAEAPADGASPLGSLGSLGGGMDLPFNLMKANIITYDPDGNAVLTTNVRIESPDFNVSCDKVTLNNKTKMVVATGAPVKLDKGPEMQGQCRTLTHNIDKKSTKLEGNASIVQDNKNGQKVQTSADIIQIDMNEKGQPTVSLMMTSGRQPEIRVLGKEKQSSSKSKSGGAKKINEGNLGAIEVPTPKNLSVE